MMNSLEVRSPFLDYDLIDAIRKIPNKFKLKGNISKYILKKSFERTLPASNPETPADSILDVLGFLIVGLRTLFQPKGI